VGYQYSHDFPGKFVNQDYLGAERRYYVPGDQGVERKIRDRLQFWKDQSAKKENDGSNSD
jgi:putative ATPase